MTTDCISDAHRLKDTLNSPTSMDAGELRVRLQASAAWSEPLIAIRGAFLNPKSDEEMAYFPRGVLVLERFDGATSKSGIDGGQFPAEYRIRFLENETLLPGEILKRAKVVDLTGYVLMPSFIDLHFHWVQDDVCAAPKDNLLDWLTNYVFPKEAKFRDEVFAESCCRSFARRLARLGTFGGAAFGSLHPCTVRLALKHFVGNFLVGNPLMDVNSPSFLTHTTEQALEDVKALSKEFGTRFAVTPRFAITTTPGLMIDSSKVAHEAGGFIQTHLSEATREIATILEMYRALPGFQDVKNPTEVYDRVGVLTDKAIMAHAIHLSREEFETLAARGTSIAHCPTSNAPVEELGLGSGLFDFRMATETGVKWALGSDIGAGPWPSMTDVIHSFVTQHRRRGIREATYGRGLYRATLAGAQILGIGEESGNFASGKWANFVACPLPDGVNLESMSGEALLEQVIATPLNQDRANSETLVHAAFYRGVLQV